MEKAHFVQNLLPRWEHHQTKCLSLRPSVPLLRKNIPIRMIMGIIQGNKGEKKGKKPGPTRLDSVPLQFQHNSIQRKIPRLLMAFRNPCA